MINTSRTYILSQPHSFVDYPLEPLRRDSRFVVRTHKRRRSLGATIKRFLRSILPGAHPGLWSEDILGTEYVELIRQIRPGDRLIFWAVGNKKDIRIITEDVATNRITSLLWDPLRQICHFSGREIKEYPGFMRRLGVRLCTFDPDDAEKYGLDYVGQVYRYPDPSETEVKPNGKVLFIGVDKRRNAKIDRVVGLLESEGIPYDFRILRDKHSWAPGTLPRLDKCVMSAPIPYREVLDITRDSACLLDILQPGQTGMTMRVLEALFMGKKLITDNLLVKSEPFYRKENIYVLDDPDQPYPSLKAFLDTPMAEVDDSIIRSYDISRWIERL